MNTKVLPFEKQSVSPVSIENRIIDAAHVWWILNQLWISAGNNKLGEDFPGGYKLAFSFAATFKGEIEVIAKEEELSRILQVAPCTIRRWKKDLFEIQKISGHKFVTWSQSYSHETGKSGPMRYRHAWYEKVAKVLEKVEAEGLRIPTVVGTFPFKSELARKAENMGLRVVHPKFQEIFGGVTAEYEQVEPQLPGENYQRGYVPKPLPDQVEAQWVKILATIDLIEDPKEKERVKNEIRYKAYKL